MRLNFEPFMAEDTYLASLLKLEQESIEKDFKDFDMANSDNRNTDTEIFKVFVYGSLLKGFGNNVLLKDSKFVQSAVTKQRYKMVSLGGYPGVLKARKSELDKHSMLPSKYAMINRVFRPIKGELYEVDKKTLIALDGLEGNGYFYKREIVPLKSGGGEAWMYILLNSSQYKLNKLCATDVFDNYCWRTERENCSIKKGVSLK